MTPDNRRAVTAAAAANYDGEDDDDKQDVSRRNIRVDTTSLVSSIQSGLRELTTRQLRSSEERRYQSIVPARRYSDVTSAAATLNGAAVAEAAAAADTPNASPTSLNRFPSQCSFRRRVRRPRRTADQLFIQIVKTWRACHLKTNSIEIECNCRRATWELR